MTKYGSGMEIRRTSRSRPYLWAVTLMLLGLWLGSVLAKGASNQTKSQTWQQQRYQSQSNESLLLEEEPALTEPETTPPIVSSPHETHLTRTSVIFGLTKVANESSVSQKCHAQLRQVQRGILVKQPWAMKGKCGWDLIENNQTQTVFFLVNLILTNCRVLGE